MNTKEKEQRMWAVREGRKHAYSVTSKLSSKILSQMSMAWNPHRPIPMNRYKK